MTPRRPISFLGFCQKLGVELEPGQRVAAKVCFDGVEPCELEGEERELARLIFGPDVERVPPLARAIIVWVVGARGGKSYIFSLRSLHLALTVPLDTIAPGQKPSVTITAPDLDLAGEDIGYIRGAIRSNPQLLAQAVSGHEEESKSLSIVLRRGPHLLTISARAASSKGKTGRGRSLPCFVLDEAAIFQDVDHAISDVDAFKALSPRVMPGGQGLVGSTPWGEEGLLFDLWQANWNNPQTCLVAQAPTRVLRTNAGILAQVEREERRDPENAEREFGARFVKTALRQFFEGETLDKVFTDDALEPPRPGDMVTVGSDLAFQRNSSALAAFAGTRGLRRLVALVERKPDPGQPLKPSAVCKDFARLARSLGADGIMSDAHARATALEHFEQEAGEASAEPIALLHAPTDPGDVFVAVRTLMREGKVRISKHHPLAERLRKQLRAVKSRILTGGRTSIVMPQAADGSHCDLVSALVLALWQEHGAEVAEPPPRIGTEEHWKAVEAHMLEAWEEKHAPKAQETWWE